MLRLLTTPLLYPGVGAFVLIRPAQTFYERINVAASNNSFTIDNSAPTVALSYSKDPVRDADTLVVTATFNEAVTGTPTIAIDVAGTADLSATSMTDSGDQTTFTFSYDVPAGSDGAATVTIAAATDAAGNPNAAASNDSFTIDNTAPTVALLTHW